MMATDAIVYAENIVMIGDIAARQGVSRAAIQGWMRRPGFPKPVAEIRAGAVYDYSQILRWKKKRAEALRARADRMEGLSR